MEDDTVLIISLIGLLSTHELLSAKVVHGLGLSFWPGLGFGSYGLEEVTITHLKMFFKTVFYFEKQASQKKLF